MVADFALQGGSVGFGDVGRVGDYQVEGRGVEGGAQVG
jgi:hypothetical protein